MEIKSGKRSNVFTEKQLSIINKNGLDYNCCKNRLALGWDIEKAISTPKRKHSVITTNVLKKLNENNISIELYRKRIGRGYSKELASSLRRYERVSDFL